MSCELERIAADIVIARLSANSAYAAQTNAEELAKDFQTIYNQLRYCDYEAGKSELAKKYSN